MRTPRKVCHAEKISVNGCKRPSSSSPCVNPGATCAGKTGGSGGGSDPIVASDHDEMVAQSHGLVGVEAGDHDRGLMGSGCMQHERCQPQGAFDGSTVQIDMLQPCQWQQLHGPKPNAMTRLEHFAIQPVSPGAIHPGLPKQEKQTQQQQPNPSSHK